MKTRYWLCLALLTLLAGCSTGDFGRPWNSRQSWEGDPQFREPRGWNELRPTAPGSSGLLPDSITF